MARHPRSAGTHSAHSSTSRCPRAACRVGRRSRWRMPARARGAHGRRIAFVRYDGAIADIYVMTADGSEIMRRTTGADLWSAAWSPDGRRPAVSTEGVYSSDIWLLSTDDDGSDPVHLASDARSPVWSPDGREIAYVHISGDDGYDAIAVANVDGTNARDLTPAQGGRIRDHVVARRTTSGLVCVRSRHVRPVRHERGWHRRPAADRRRHGVVGRLVVTRRSVDRRLGVGVRGDRRHGDRGVCSRGRRGSARRRERRVRALVASVTPARAPPPPPGPRRQPWIDPP